MDKAHRALVMCRLRCVPGLGFSTWLTVNLPVGFGEGWPAPQTHGCHSPCTVVSQIRSESEKLMGPAHGSEFFRELPLTSSASKCTRLMLLELTLYRPISTRGWEARPSNMCVPKGPIIVCFQQMPVKPIRYIQDRLIFAQTGSPPTIMPQRKPASFGVA